MSRPDDTEEAGSGFLDRWARRKQEARRLDAQPADVAEAPAVDLQPEPVQPAEELPLPSLDDIVPGADVSAFFHKHVPDALRTAALRKLWVTDPTIRDFIEMADYQWDFNNPDSIPGWSSSIGDFDVKTLVDRIMGGVEPPKPEAASAPGPTALEEPLDAIRESTENAEETTTSEPGPGEPDALAGADVAVQKTPDKSEVYEGVRKRHGGALPS